MPSPSSRPAAGKAKAAPEPAATPASAAASGADGAYDVVIIGSGPGGYVCAVRAAQLGLKVACIERSPQLGGTCLNVGCIPSKALLHASERFEEARHLQAMGIGVGAPHLDLAAMMAFKRAGVEGNTRGVEFLFRKNKVAHVPGKARIAGAGRVEVDAPGGVRRVCRGKSIVIATGSRPAALGGVDIDEEGIVSSTGALELPQTPRHLVVIGAGYIGLEMGSVWRRLGAKVTVVEMEPRIAPGMDGEVCAQFRRILERQGMAFRLGVKVDGVARGEGGFAVALTPVNGAGGADGAQSLSADVVLVATGRTPCTDGLGLEAAGVKLDKAGRIRTDGDFQTSAAGIYAIGDVIAGPMLAHKASEEGVALAETLAGKAGAAPQIVPGVIYTAPEVAAVGRTEEQLKADGVSYKAGKFPFTANGRAKVNRVTEGFVKILAEEKTDRILGVHILGADAGTMIAEAAVAMEFGASAEDLARTCHAHPTLNEAVKEAALAVDGRALHM